MKYTATNSRVLVHPTPRREHIKVHGIYPPEQPYNHTSQYENKNKK
jgi:hypothetical protein